jgi:hypothetical protein
MIRKNFGIALDIFSEKNYNKNIVDYEYFLKKNIGELFVNKQAFLYNLINEKEMWRTYQKIDDYFLLLKYDFDFARILFLGKDNKKYNYICPFYFRKFTEDFDILE